MKTPMQLLQFPGGPESQQGLLDDMKEMVAENKLRYIHITAIDRDGVTLSAWAGQSNIMERLGLLQLCADSELFAANNEEVEQ